MPSRPTLLVAVALLASAGAAQVPPDAADGVKRFSTIVVSATREERDPFDLPHATSTLGADALQGGPGARSLPHALSREPSVMVQKTGPGQSSPYIRGFTGFRTLMLVDGVRLNNSVFRDGPNQYFGTVDPYSIDRLELTRGPGSVNWGSDAIGGVINAVTAPAPDRDAWGGRYAMRWSSAERATFHRVEGEVGKADAFGLRVGVTDKTLGNVVAGGDTGVQPGTAFDERDADARLDVPLDGGELTVVAQSVRQDDVPRTHRTVEAQEFHGTTPGTELRRDLDQERELIYGRLRFDGDGTLFDEGSVTLSHQRQREIQERLRTGDRFDRSGLHVRTLGAAAEFHRDSPLGALTWGLDHYVDRVDSFREDFVGGVSTGAQIQGPVGDDARYALSGAFLQDTIAHGDGETVLGLRWSRAAARADEVDNPNVKGSDPATPGNVLSVDERWSNLVGSVRTLHRVDERTAVWAGVSQGFRAPNLSDLTSDLTDSGVEQPTPDLQPEHFVALEVGARHRGRGWEGEVTLWSTSIRDMIVRSPTGEVIDDTPVQVKDNVGDGWLWGVECRAECRPGEEWTLFGSASWMDGEVDQFELPSGDEVSEPIDRLMPLSGVVGATWDPLDTPWWLQADVAVAAKADRLSLRDETDTERIPPGGTPGHAVLGLRGGMEVAGGRLGLGLENLLDADHRVHGSGVNEPGRSLVVTYERRF